MLTEMSLKEFVLKTSSNSPTPGGGSIAALAGSLAAALSTMVIRLTTGKKYFAELPPSEQQDLRDALESLFGLSQELLHSVAADAASFDEVMAAFQMPKGTEEQVSARKEAIQAGYRSAASVPLDTATKCLQVLKISVLISKNGNPDAVTDAATSALMAHAGVQGALYNVRINMKSIRDEAHVVTLRREAQTIDAEAQMLSDEILAICEARLSQA